MSGSFFWNVFGTVWTLLYLFTFGWLPALVSRITAWKSGEGHGWTHFGIGYPGYMPAGYPEYYKVGVIGTGDGPDGVVDRSSWERWVVFDIVGREGAWIVCQSAIGNLVYLSWKTSPITLRRYGKGIPPGTRFAARIGPNGAYWFATTDNGMARLKRVTDGDQDSFSEDELEGLGVTLRI